MANSNLYFYRYENFEDIVAYINKYKNVSMRHHLDFIHYIVELHQKNIQDINTYVVNLYSKVEILNFIIVKNLKIICIITEKYSYIKNFYSDNKLLKINLLNNNLFYKIFQKKISHNLMKLSMNTENINAVINEIDLIGNRLHDCDILYNLNSYILDESTHLSKYSFQPSNYNFTINVTSKNKIEIRDNKAKKEDIISFVYSFILFLSVYGGLDE